MYTYTLMLSPSVFNPSDLGQNCVLESGNSGRKPPNAENTFGIICSPLIISFTAKKRLFFKKKKVYLVILIDRKAVT